MNFAWIKVFLLLIFFVVWDCLNSKQKAKQHKQKTSPQSYKAQTKITNYKVICNWNKSVDFIRNMTINNTKILKQIKNEKNNCNF